MGSAFTPASYEHAARFVGRTPWDFSRDPDPQRIYREVDRVLNIIGGRTNCVLGTGALPLETPPENVHLIERYLA